LPKTEEEGDAMLMRRVEKNDPVAMWFMGGKRDGEGDYSSAFEYWTKAAELGEANPHYNLSIKYHLGQGVQKDEKKQVYHLEKAAIGGNVLARHALGCHEANNGRMERAAKHFTIAANMGDEDSMSTLWKLHLWGFLKKENLTATLRAHRLPSMQQKVRRGRKRKGCRKALKLKINEWRENKARRCMDYRGREQMGNKS
jgi:hypothetical protein